MASVDGAPISPSDQAKVNGIVEHDAAKGRVPVHTFDPDASPEEKAAAAGKNSGKLGLNNDDLKASAKGAYFYPDGQSQARPGELVCGTPPTAVGPSADRGAW